VMSYNPNIEQNAENWTVSDAGITVAMQKQFKIDFVPPLDVNTGSKAANKTLAARYWTVYTPGAFTRLAAKANAERWFARALRPFHRRSRFASRGTQ
jgi:hypothetical protein